MVRIVDFVDEGLGHSSYLIDLGDGSVAVIDPPRFPLPHETLANREGLRLAWTADTHSHADYVTGSPGLAARPGSDVLRTRSVAARQPPRGGRRRTAHRSRQRVLVDSCRDAGPHTRPPLVSPRTRR